MSTAFARDAELLRSLVHRIDPNDPGAFNNLGVLYHTKGLHAEAVDAFLRALALDSRMRTAARNLEIAAAAPGACDSRLAELAQRVAFDPDDLVARREEVRLLRLIGRFDDATRRCDALIAEVPDDAAALLERGLLEQRAGDLRRAHRWLERAYNAAPRDVIARLHLAEVLYHRGSNEQSLAILDELLADDASIADAHLLRGFVLGDIGRHEAAAAAASEAARINPALATLQADLSIDGGNSLMPVAVADGGELARYGLALAFRQRGYLDGARRELLRALENGEDHRLVEHALAEIDIVTGNAQDAVQRYTTLLDRYGDVARLWCEHGVALHQCGRVEEAAESYRRALRTEPRYALAYNNLGVALAHAGDAAAAREALLRAIELDATLVRARLNLARWYVRQRDGLGAMALLRELTTFRPTDATAWFELGAVMASLGRDAEARQAFVKAIELDASHAGARYALADVLARLGDQDGAARETQQALVLSPMRPESRMQLGIELQQECPDATASIDLLMLDAAEPLAGTTMSEDAISSLLRESDAEVRRAAEVRTPIEQAMAACEEADRFAMRGLHGEAAERYLRACDLLDRAVQDAGAPSEMAEHCAELRRRARIGDARSRCLLGRGDELLTLLRDMADVLSDDVELLALLAAAEAQAVARGIGTRDTVRRVMRSVLNLLPDSAALLHFVGDAASMIRDEEFAMLFFRRALTADPSRPTPRVAIARMLRKRGDTLAAQLELVAALATMPGMREARSELAQVHLLRHRPADAIVLLTAMLEEDPTDVESLVLLGEALLALERFPDARIAVGHARRHDPDHARALLLEGQILAALGRTREARERWQRVLSLGDDATATLAREVLARGAERWQDTPFDGMALTGART